MWSGFPNRDRDVQANGLTGGVHVGRAADDVRRFCRSLRTARRRRSPCSSSSWKLKGGKRTAPCYPMRSSGPRPDASTKKDMHWGHASPNASRPASGIRPIAFFSWYGPDEASTIVTDHGWLLMPGGLPHAALDVGLVEPNGKRTRCALVKAKSANLLSSGPLDLELRGLGGDGYGSEVLFCELRVRAWRCQPAGMHPARSGGGK